MSSPAGATSRRGSITSYETRSSAGASPRADHRQRRRWQDGVHSDDRARAGRAGRTRSTPRPAGNGATIELDGSASRPTGTDRRTRATTSNDDVLEEFFAPYAGDDPQPRAHETRLIAINEGRLLDFIADEERRGRYRALSARARAGARRRSSSGEDWLLVVNLNLRALTLAGEPPRSDIVGATLERFADARLWEPCATCRAQRQCYAKANAAQLRDPVLGPRARERIRQTLDVVRLRRRMHITMRDLRSALAFMVAGNRRCEEIVELVDAEQEPSW